MVMKGYPLVSVLMPAFNARRFVRGAIQSILDQTYTHWELLVCDDASTDETFTEIKRLAAGDSRVKLFQNVRNLRLLKTRNQLLEYAKGDFITFQDADDYSNRYRLEKLVNALLSNQRLGLVSSQIGYLDSAGCLFRVSERPTDYQTILRLIYHDNVVGGSNMMVRREALDSVGGRFRPYFDGLSYQDYDLSFLIAQKFECYNLPDVLYYYRQHGDSASKTISVDRYIAREVVKHLGLQRKVRGMDDLQEGHPEKVDLYFEELRKPFRKDISLIYRTYAGDFMYSKLYRKAISASVNAIKARPTMIKNYRTLFYCVRKAFTY